MTCMFKSLALTLSLLGLSTAFATSPVFHITPSTTSINVRSDSTSAITWTVTNHTSKAIQGLSIHARYHTLSPAQGITFQNDGCSATTLSSNSSCTFSTLINSSGQPDNFEFMAQVCGFNGAICSQPTLANYVQVSFTHPGFSSVYAYIATQTSGMGRLIPYNVSTLTMGTPLTGFNFENGTGIVVSQDGTKIYFTGVSDNVLYIASGGSSPTLLGSLDGFEENANLSLIALSPDGKTAYVGGSLAGSGLVYVINIEDSAQPTLISMIEELSSPTGIAFTPDGSKAYVVSFGIHTGSVSVINTTTHTIEEIIPIGGYAYSIAAHPDGSKMYVTSAEDNSIYVINTLNNTATPISFSPSIQPAGVVVSPDGTRLYITDGANPQVIVIDTHTNSLVGDPIVIDCADSLSGISISPDGKTLFVISSTTDMSVGVIQLDNNNAQTTIYLPEGATAAFVMGNFVG